MISINVATAPDLTLFLQIISYLKAMTSELMFYLFFIFFRRVHKFPTQSTPVKMLNEPKQIRIFERLHTGCRMDAL